MVCLAGPPSMAFNQHLAEKKKKSAPAAHPDGDEGGKDGDHDNWEDLESSPPNQPSTKHD